MLATEKKEMRVLDNIERIKAQSKDILYKDYLLKQKPAIITDLFEGQTIRTLSTIEKAREALSDLRLDTLEEYVSKFLRDNTYLRNTQEFKFSDYLDFVRDNPSTKLNVREFDTPEEVRTLFELPEYCNLKTSSDVSKRD